MCEFYCIGINDEGKREYFSSNELEKLRDYTEDSEKEFFPIPEALR